MNEIKKGWLSSGRTDCDYMAVQVTVSERGIWYSIVYLVNTPGPRRIWSEEWGSSSAERNFANLERRHVANAQRCVGVLVVG